MPATVVLTFRNLFKNVRTPMLVIASVAQPLVWLVMFSQTFRGLADTPLLRGLGYRSYLAFLLPGMMVLAVLFTALQSGLAMVSDIDSGMLDKLRVSPINRLSILLGRVLADAVTMLAQGAVVLVAGTLMGARVETGWLGTFGMLASVTLLGVAWASLANLIALRSGNAELTMVAGIFLALPALFLSPAFLPLRFQPDWVQTVARFNPASYVIGVGQALMSIGNDWGQDARMLAGYRRAFAPARNRRRLPRGDPLKESIDRDATFPTSSALGYPAGSALSTTPPGERAATAEEPPVVAGAAVRRGVGAQTEL